MNITVFWKKSQYQNHLYRSPVPLHRLSPIPRLGWKSCVGGFIPDQVPLLWCFGCRFLCSEIRIHIHSPAIHLGSTAQIFVLFLPCSFGDISKLLTEDLYLHLKPGKGEVSKTISCRSHDTILFHFCQVSFWQVANLCDVRYWRGTYIKVGLCHCIPHWELNCHSPSLAGQAPIAPPYGGEQGPTVTKWMGRLVVVNTGFACLPPAHWPE